MKLNALLKVKARSAKRVGRGLGSGKGKQAGRGTKGQKARGSIPAGFSGDILPLYKKLPFRRGIGNAKKSIKMIPLSLSKLDFAKAGEEIDMQSLIKSGIIKEGDAKKRGVKIMGTGEINKALTVKLPVTSAAATKIEKVGGKVVRG